jgi:cell division transport system permease protein
VTVFGIVTRNAAFQRTARGPLVLSDPAATRALVGIVAILTFLAGLAAAGAEVVAASSREWRAAIASEATIQIRPRQGRDIEADLARAAALARGVPGVLEANVLSKADAEALLEPWLGQGLELGSLPIPRLVVLRVDRGAGPDLGRLKREVEAAIPASSLDDHDAWRARLSAVASTIVGVAAGLVLLVVAAAALAVAFATRGAMGGSRDAVDVLQLVGASDRFVARAFARRFLKLAFLAALAGAAASALAVPLLGWAVSLVSGAGEADAAFLGSVSIGWRGFALIGLVALTVTAIAGVVSVWTAKRFLRQLRAS